MSAARTRRPRGSFIVLEGLDGAGTTTQLERLAAALRARGEQVLTSREPSDGPIGTQIRQALTGRLTLPHGRGPLSPETLALLFAADRTDHLAARILPALEEGRTVLCDRYVLSSLAYQGASLPMAWVAEVNRWARAPDLTLFLEVDLSTASRRRGVRGGPQELFEAEEAQAQVARRYREAIRRRQAHERIVRLDGTKSVEEVTAAALATIDRELGRRRKA